MSSRKTTLHPAERADRKINASQNESLWRRCRSIAARISSVVTWTTFACAYVATCCATGVKSLESETLAEPASPAVLQADAAGIDGATDAGLTPPWGALPASVVGGIPDDRLLTVAEVAAFLKVPKSAVYSACDLGDLQYVKFEGIVQVEGRELKAWLVSCHRTPSSTP